MTRVVGTAWVFLCLAVPWLSPMVAAAATIGGGSRLTAVVKPDGTAWTWGQNQEGQLGDATTTSRTTLTSTNAFARIAGSTLAANTCLTTDGDGLPTWREFLLHTDPLVMDTNGDGIPDGPDVDAGRVPDNTDADGDGLSNSAEAQRGTDPLNPDSDGDLVNDRLDLCTRDARHRTQHRRGAGRIERAREGSSWCIDIIACLQAYAGRPGARGTSLAH